MSPPWRNRLAVRVTKDAERQVRAGHPWIFDRSIRSAKSGKPGDLAVIFDHDRRFLAVGLYDPTSPIVIRILAAGKQTKIDDEWLAITIAAALDRRRSLVESADTNAYRIIHGENDGLGGLVVDQYDDTLVLKLYTEAWLPWLDHVVPALLQVVGERRVIVRLSRRVAATTTGRRLWPEGELVDGMVIHGPALDGPLTFRENGLRFLADPARGHKTGHFLDQRDNRDLVRSLSDGARVLDVFACTGGFSVHAADGGAITVTSVDVSAPALELARVNLQRNGDRIGSVELRIVVGDAFAVMADLTDQGEQFDLVVVDPPAFAQNRSQLAGALHAHDQKPATEPTLAQIVDECLDRRAEGDALRGTQIGEVATEPRRERVGRH